MRRPLSTLLALLFLLAPVALRAEVVNRVVLRINDQIATLHDYQQRRQDLVREVMRRTDLDEAERRQFLEQAPEVVFRDMYQELLLESRAQQLGVDVTRVQIDAAVSNMKESFGLKTDEEFRAALAQSGMTEAQLRQQLQKSLRIREVMDREVRSRVQLEEEDLRRYYRKNQEQFREPEQVRVQEVVVLDAGGLATAEERARVAAEIRQAVAGGNSLAEAVDDLRQKGVTSGVIDLGWVAPGDLDSDLEAAAWNLQPGALSEPVPGRGGLHLIQVLERRESRIVPFSEVAEQIMGREQERVYSEEFTKYLAELEERSLIVAAPPQDASGFRRLLSRPATNTLDLAPVRGRRGQEEATPEATTAPEATSPGVTPQATAEPPAEAPLPPPPSAVH